MSFAAMMLVGMLVDAAVGWPDRLYARIGHPVTWLGALISGCERRLNTGRASRRRAMGAATVGVVCFAALVPALFLQSLLPSGWLGLVIGGLFAWPLIAVRAMYTHVDAVVRPLLAGDLIGARGAVAMIVGRTPDQLDSDGVARAGLESLAENTSDGIIAPLFWGVVAGLPGIAVYKAINTMDSMIGHRNARYEDFGKVAARLDDLVNLIPARLTGGLFALVSGRFGPAWRVMARDARHHRSPNAGWPEAAMAGALEVRLSGPRSYGDQHADDPWVNAGAADPGADGLRRGLALYLRAMIGTGAILAALAVL